jgi:hypothetical protein
MSRNAAMPGDVLIAELSTVKAYFLTAAVQWCPLAPSIV